MRRRCIGPTPVVGRYGEGTGEPSTSAAIRRCRSASQRLAGSVSMRIGIPTTITTRVPATAFRTNSTSAGIDSRTCAAAYPVIRSRPVLVMCPVSPIGRPDTVDLVPPWRRVLALLIRRLDVATLERSLQIPT